MGCASSSPPPPDKPTAAGSTNGYGSSSRNSRGERSFFDIYTMQEKLGKGSFAQVRSALHIQTGQTYAVKIMDMRMDPETDVGHMTVAQINNLVLDQERRNDAINEAAIWKKVGDHEHVLGLREAFLESGCSFFIMTKCDFGLLPFLRTGAGSPELNEHSVGRVVVQMLKACQYVHSLSIAHRDIKPDNWLVLKGVLKLCDFGLASMVPPEGVQGVNGTAPYLAPEMLKGQKYSVIVDVWSVGALAYTLMLGEFPYNGAQRTAKEMKRAIRDGKQSPSFKPTKAELKGGVIVEPLSETARSFLKRLLSRDPKNRPDTAQALEHEYLQNCLTSAPSALPCMLPAIVGAVKAGAFGVERKLEVRTNLDKLLGRLQKETQDKPLMQEAVAACEGAMAESETGSLMTGMLNKSSSTESTVSAALSQHSAQNSIPSTSVRPNVQAPASQAT